jgi:hypothetical protein
MAYEWETDEWHRAVRDLSEAERVVNCGHTSRQVGEPCPDCGDEVEP